MWRESTDGSVVQGRHATSKFMLEVDGVTWSLCHDRKPFIEIALATILLDNIRHRDRSGEDLYLTPPPPHTHSLTTHTMTTTLYRSCCRCPCLRCWRKWVIIRASEITSI